MNTALSLLSTAVTFAFMAMVLDQYLERRRPYQAVWAASLCCFGLAVLVESIANAAGWSVIAYRFWFLFGAALAAATLGLGTAYLLLPPAWARGITAAFAVAAAWAAYRILSAPIDAASVIPPHGQARPPSAQGIPIDLTLLVIVLNSLGTLAVVGGALWSAGRYWGTRGKRYRAFSNLLIAAGALVVAASGSLAGLGRPEYLFLGELAGIVIIFAGFLRSQPRLRAGSLPLLRHLRSHRRSWASPA